MTITRCRGRTGSLQAMTMLLREISVKTSWWLGTTPLLPVALNVSSPRTTLPPTITIEPLWEIVQTQTPKFKGLLPIELQILGSHSTVVTIPHNTVISTGHNGVFTERTCLAVDTSTGDNPSMGICCCIGFNVLWIQIMSMWTCPLTTNQVVMTWIHMTGNKCKLVDSCWQIAFYQGLTFYFVLT